MHEHLWAPWRLSYVKRQELADAQPRALAWLEGSDRECFLCRAVADVADRENLVVQRGELTFTILNRFPYNNGHLMVAPRRHVGRLTDLDDATQAECVERLRWWVARMERRLGAQGFNIGLNLGAVAGAGVPGHLHWHIVPRWSGDVNFMPVVADTKVIPQALDALWHVLTKPEE